jgi:hypothetical protein
MTNPPEEHLKRIYSHLPTVRNLFDLAISDYNRECGNIRYKISRRSRASLIHDNIVHRAKELFNDTDEVSFKVIRGLFVLFFGGYVCLRFKKLDKRKRSSNIQTQQTLSFMNQMEIPDIPQTTKMVAGYQFNDLETDFAVYITYPNGSSSVPWNMLLESPPDNVIEMQTPHKGEISGKGVTLKFINEQRKKKKEENNETGKS